VDVITLSHFVRMDMYIHLVEVIMDNWDMVIPTIKNYQSKLLGFMIRK